MVHGRDSSQALVEREQLYDIHGHCLLAIDRVTLTELLLNELESLPNVKLFFRHKITTIDLKQQQIQAKDENLAERHCQNHHLEQQDISQHVFDLLLGCDGTHSAVRTSMMRSSRLDYSQTWVDILWCQFTIPAATAGSFTTPSASNGFSVSPDHLHIWPNNEMMLMAIPAADKSTAGTLFASLSTFAELERNPSQVEHFFMRNFPGAAELIGLESIRKQFEMNAHEPLISIKCSPHVYGSCAVILGDAAHAMVRFYGQGVNAGLEDVQVLFRCLNESEALDLGLGHALECYNAERVADAHAINDLAISNYWEIRAGVRSRYHLLHKAFEEVISRYAPFTGFVTQYSRVSFSNQRYSKISYHGHIGPTGDTPGLARLEDTFV
ncbi:kynurenine 3-monooxygenase, mitochondrial precursor [Recurvomyces mirabilis]|uniref:Kynurenine 3-monooxygenase, mitochondrial n=1 Tax=Recurvomyces mirabilis TaxID=574656 RepID=A0AAE1C228_9PEZI|nr:kynurenine 3-monooxygenase, mitochondrial precursor [Recurvomyces mirabilis]KAK5157938.1 kynurenine 3-monooxygenase, mitochondrial precursor [Recurvomyces mirabilis]